MLHLKLCQKLRSLGCRSKILTSQAQPALGDFCSKSPSRPRCCPSRAAAMCSALLLHIIAPPSPPLCPVFHMFPGTQAQCSSHGARRHHSVASNRPLSKQSRRACVCVRAWGSCARCDTPAHLATRNCAQKQRCKAEPGTRTRSGSVSRVYLSVSDRETPHSGCF